MVLVNMNPNIPKKLSALSQVATEKSRLRKSARGSSGSAWYRSQTTKAAITNTPAAMASGMVSTEPAIEPQL